MMTKMLPIMMALDSDGDGALSASEIEHASKALLKLDKDGDGLLSADELRPDPSKMPGLMAGVGQGGGVQGQAPGAMMVKMLEQRDANKDGKLEGDEIPERMRERIGMIDKDGDGAISKSELERAAASFGDRGGPGPRGRNESDGSGVKPKRPGSDN
jgi:Ca2+-binding EF-hand superfamily protein